MSPNKRTKRKLPESIKDNQVKDGEAMILEDENSSAQSNQVVGLHSPPKFRNAFLVDLEALNWSDVFQMDNIDMMIQIFNRFILNTIDKHAPERLIVMRKLPASWLGADIKRMMVERMMRGIRLGGYRGGVEATLCTNATKD
ncbi:hypothetical protein DMN91_003362 [Ooceraea biroi]|uniref:Uncharacterized protein n=1 Tax=Ooceraea biroi TaxID=2015173 RepID=A0A3L8DZA3_OOCBI|nr:hypothetical protein DMN91_003362 [Ooceraea biroi]